MPHNDIHLDNVERDAHITKVDGNHIGDRVENKYVSITNVTTFNSQDDSRQIEHYLSWLFQKTQDLDLRGIDPQAATQRDTCLNLPQIYTALMTTSTAEHEARINERRDGPDQKNLRSAVDMLNAEKHLVLLGDPGSGKSMFVNFVTLCMAGELLGEECANREILTCPLPNEHGEPGEEVQPWNWGGLLPVKFVLREVAAKELPEESAPMGTVTHLLDYLKHVLADYDLAQAFEALKRHLDEQGGIVLFDGLDEVPEADKRRSQVLNAVEEFANRYKKCRILVTCRIYAYQQQEWRVKNFQPAVLAPFTDGQIRGFVNGWYRHVADKRGTNRKNWQGRAELLKQAIFRSSQLRSFARRPLLLTLMASLHAWRQGSLPEKRAELYENATNMLLDTWVQGKFERADDGTRLLTSPSLEEVLDVSKDELKTVLQQLAFEAHQRQTLHQQGTADIPEKDLIHELYKLCDKKGQDMVRGLAKHLSNRVGLLVSHANGVYSFPHRSFQEYLAACHLSGSVEFPDNVADLVRKSPDRWREVALLVAAQCSRQPRMLILLVNALCPESVPEIAKTATDADALSAILAAQAVVEAEQVNKLTAGKPKDVALLKDWLKAILTEQQPQQPLPALERARAGDLLAVFGDERPGVGLKNGLPDIEWCEVLEGAFLMGSANDDEDAYSQEKPQHPVTVSAFDISRFPITNAQFKAFIDDGGYTEQWQTCWDEDGWEKKTENNWNGPEEYRDPFGFSNHPLVGVSWYEADAFCKWLTIRLHTTGDLPEDMRISLPTEAQWEYAARGPESRKFPWKDAEITSELANYGDSNLNATNSVGCFPRGRSWCDAEEMSGNVWEWCNDWFQSAYYKESPDRNPQGPDSGEELLDGEPDRVYRGGSWDYSARDLRSAYRFSYWPRGRFDDLGFRPVRIYV